MQFHQIEGLAVDEDITLADLKGTLLAFAKAIFGTSATCACARTSSPSPTERRGRRPLLPVRRHRRAEEPRPLQPVQGHGVAGDPRLRDGRPQRLGYVRDHGYDPRRTRASPFAGVERIAMLKHAVPDLRLFYDNDVRFLRQFG